MQPTATTSADALNQLQQYQGTLQSPSDALNAAKQTLGVNAAQGTATGLQGAIQNTTNLLNNVAPSVYGRTGNSLVTTAQAGQQISNASAPIQANLDKEGTDYTNAEQNYTNLDGQAEQQAQDELSQQATKESGLQSLYSDLYGQEKDSADLAEQEREANLSASSKASSSDGLGSTLASLLGGSGASSSAASYQQRSGGGFNFQSPSGTAISAAQYSQLTGTPLRTLLSQMASEGDTGAKTALNYVGNDYGINSKAVGNNQQVKNILNSILGGVNKI